MTAIQTHADGYWLRVDPVACTFPLRHAPTSLRRRLIGWRPALAAAVVAASAAVVETQLAVATPSGAERATESGVAAPPAAAAVPAPPPPLARSFERWGGEYGVPIPLLEALTWHESRWQPQAVSETGAIGLGQLMPPTAAAVAASLGEDLDPWKADDNVRMSAHLLGTLMSSAGGDAEVALAGYAQGASSVQREGMMSTTRQYVDEILALFDQFRGADRARTT